MKIFSKRNITIYTILVFIATMIIFEIGFCNVQVIHQIFNNQEIVYNFSPCRIVVYLVFIILYCIFRNKFLETAEETFQLLKCGRTKFPKDFDYSNIFEKVRSIYFGKGNTQRDGLVEK